MAAADAAGGLYVGFAARAVARSAKVLTYYSAAALQAVNPVPTSVVAHSAAFDLAAGPAGGVVYVHSGADFEGTVTTWDPGSQ